MGGKEKEGGQTRPINIAKVTQKLVARILSMSAEERSVLLKSLEERDEKKEKEEPQGRDQRRSARVLYTAEVDFVVGETPYKGMILDISEEGARIASCDIPPAGAEVRMAFRLPGRRNAHVCLLGVVVRDAEKDFGVSFHKGLNPALQRYDIKIIGNPDKDKEK